jgi:hypothetical protein
VESQTNARTDSEVLFKRGIFSTARLAWCAVLVYTLFLYASLTLTYDLYMQLFNRIGQDSVSSLFNWTYLVLAAALLSLMVWRLPKHTGAYLSFLIIALIAGYVLHLEEVPANRVHFLQYGPLTVLVLDALRFRLRDRYIYVWTLVVVSLIGVGDEFLQGLLPDRRFDLHDVILNSLACALTLSWLGWVLGESNYPWPKPGSTPGESGTDGRN